jgi:hypothetical protein
MTPDDKIYVFGNFRLDASERCLKEGEEERPLTAKAFALLLHLVQNRSRGRGGIPETELLQAAQTGSPSSLKNFFMQIYNALGTQSSIIRREQKYTWFDAEVTLAENWPTVTSSIDVEDSRSGEHLIQHPATHPALHLYHIRHHTIQAIQLVGAGSEFFPRDRIHITVDQSTYKLPSEIEAERPTLIAKLELEAHQRNQKLWDGPNTRLLNFRVTAHDSTERKHLHLTFGPIGWYDFSVVHRFLSRQPKVLPQLL